MEESQRTSIDANRAVAVNRYTAIAQIPTGNVVAGITDDFDALKEGGNKIAPFLVDEDAGFALIVAVIQQAIAPPVRESPAFEIVSNGQKSQIVSPMGKRTDLIIGDGVVRRLRLELMWRQQDRILIQHCKHRR